jgi:hypothetical protein
MKKNNIIQEEYRNKWQYIIHIEKTRFQLFSIFITIVGAFLTYFATLYSKIVDVSNLGEVNRLFTAILFLLFIYSIIMELYFIAHKQSYNVYLNRIGEIDEHELKQELARLKFRQFPTFTLFYSLVAIMSAVLFFLFLMQIKFPFIESIIFSIIIIIFEILLTIFSLKKYH